MQLFPLAFWSQTLQQAWQRRGPLACVLWPLSRVFALLSTTRKLLYRIGVFKPCRLDVPVIVVGNLVAGGAGKTPVVMAVVALLRRHGYTPGVLSRGHGRQNDTPTLEVQRETHARDCGDEPKLLHLRTGAPVLVGRERAAAGQALRAIHPEVDVIVCDDGLQHLALARDAQVIVFDERGAGNGWLLPAGPLREPLKASAPARSVVLYNASAITTIWPGSLGQRTLAGLVELGEWWRGKPASLQPLDTLRNRPLLAAAGIANPGRFFDLLRQHGLVFDRLALPDHHAFTTLPWRAGAADVIITEKDAVKIEPGRSGNTRVWVAALDFHVGPEFESDLMALLPKREMQGKDHGSSSA